MGNRILEQRGDTIIEVLLAMSVLGMVLGTSFGIVNRSLATGRDAQERSEATKLAESQVEKLKTASSDPARGYFAVDQSRIYCVTDSLGRVEFTQTADRIKQDADIATYPDECMQGPANRYKISVVRTGNVFTVRARWTLIGRTQLNEVKLVYRTY